MSFPINGAVAQVSKAAVSPAAKSAAAVRTSAVLEPAGLETCAAPEVFHRPRLGFLGVGWVGRNRLEAIARSGVAEIAAVVDPATELAEQAAQIAPGAKL